ncbi:MAG TPA: fatty acid desaturase [Labilithrix sp.]|jgi:fatty acid desaturase|nr:fatty acid desaturase [Labilithrix sp.]
MLPRNPADYRSLVWALAMPIVLVAQLTNPKLVPYLSPVSFYLAMAAGTMAHNHNHCPTFESKRMNSFYANWISVFYGYPAFAWVPTHNLNHHKHVNREGDATITWRHTNRNTWYVALSYFFVSAYYQSPPIKQYIAKAKQANPRLHRQIVTQYVIWVTALVSTLAISIALHPVWTGIKVWLFAFGLPSFFGTWSMMWFNYMQHVHCDPWSKYDHSRNITGRVFNFLVFNNGLHTVHHANAAAHWSTAYEEHAKIADKINPALNQPSFWWWIIRGYVIPAFIPSLETKQIGRAPFDPPAGARQPARASTAPVTDSVDALEAGNNAQMA